MTAHKQGLIKICCIRPVSVYGPGMKGNVLTLIKLIRKGWLPSLDKFQAKISMIGVHDLCNAAILAGNSERAEGKLYTVTDGKQYSIKELDYSIRNCLGKSQGTASLPKVALLVASLFMEIISKIFQLKNAIGYRSYLSVTQNNLFSNSQIKEELGYTPSQSLDDVLPAIISNLKSEK